ncbi:MAG TPA: hypothetical protein VKM94_13760 [Blastocatellia bacterium]|nr:hypothetical protein [Blastocatellia bacterium]
MNNTANYFVIIDRRDRAPIAYWLPAALRPAPERFLSTGGVVEGSKLEVEQLAFDSLLNNASKREP